MKKIKVFLSALLVAAMTFSCLPQIAGVHAATDVISVKITGEPFVSVSSGLVEMAFATDTTWSAVGAAAGGSYTDNKSIKINHSDNTASIRAFGTNQIAVVHWKTDIQKEGTIIKIPAGLQFQAGDVTCEIANNFGICYKSGKWEVVKAVPLSFTGIDSNTSTSNLSLTASIDCGKEYGWSEWGFSRPFQKDNPLFVDGKSHGFNGYHLTGNIFFFEAAFSVAPVSGTKVRIPKGTWLSCQDKVFEVVSDFRAQYDGKSWNQLLPRMDVTLGKIEYNPDKNQIFIGTNITGGSEEAKVLGKAGGFDVSAVSVNNGTKKIGALTVDANSGWLYIYYKSPEEGDTLTIPAGGTALAVSGIEGLRFTNTVSFHFHEGRWIIDNDGPIIYHEGIKLIEGSVITLKSGRTKNSVESEFSAVDAVTGETNVTLGFSEGAFSEGKLLSGGHTVTLSAADAWGNKSTMTVTLEAEPVSWRGDPDFDEAHTVIDLIRMKKALAAGNAEVDLFDLNEDHAADESDLPVMRGLVLGACQVIDGQTVGLQVYDKTAAAVLYADFCPDQENETEINKYKAAGFTHMLMTEDYVALVTADGKYNKTQYEAAVKKMQQAGLEVMVANTRGFDGFTNEFANLGITNFYYADEPQTTEAIKALADLVEWHNRYNAGAMFHVNLLPSYGYSSYTDYQTAINTYVEEILPKINGKKTLSIDHYPLYERLVDGGYRINELRNNYLADILTVAEAAKAYNAANPASRAVVSLCIQTYGGKSARKIESRADISFQTNMAIAMGAQNLEYFCYVSRGVDAESAMVTEADRVTTETPVYGYVRSVNEEIKNWDHVFMAYDWNGANVYNVDSALYGNAKSLLRTSFAKCSVTAEKATLVSEFVREDNTYAYMAVNASEPSAGTIDNVTLKFADTVRKVVVYRNGNGKVQTVNEGSMTLHLAAGEAAFCIPVE